MALHDFEQIKILSQSHIKALCTPRGTNQTPRYTYVYMQLADRVFVVPCYLLLSVAEYILEFRQHWEPVLSAVCHQPYSILSNPSGPSMRYNTWG